MALLIDIKHPDWTTDEALREQLLGYGPGADIRVASKPGRLEEIEMLTVSSYRPREALKYPHLMLIQMTGAGVNNILAGEDALLSALDAGRLAGPVRNLIDRVKGY